MNAFNNIALTKKEYEHYFNMGIPYASYMSNMEQEVNNKVESKYAQYIPMNLQRSNRITKTIQLISEMEGTLNLLHHKIHWLVISEHWCGDASQALPVIDAVTKASNGFIELRIIYRDANENLMNAHLTNGSQSIPKLLQLDGKFNLNGQWGPRTNEAQRLVKSLKENPETAANYAEELHKWYAKDKTISTQKDLIKLLKFGIAFCPDCMVR